MDTAVKSRVVVAMSGLLFSRRLTGDEGGSGVAHSPGYAVGSLGVILTLDNLEDQKFRPRQA